MSQLFKRSEDGRYSAGSLRTRGKINPVDLVAESLVLSGNAVVRDDITDLDDTYTDVEKFVVVDKVIGPTTRKYTLHSTLDKRLGSARLYVFDEGRTGIKVRALERVGPSFEGGFLGGDNALSSDTGYATALGFWDDSLKRVVLWGCMPNVVTDMAPAKMTGAAGATLWIENETGSLPGELPVGTKVGEVVADDRIDPDIGKLAVHDAGRETKVAVLDDVVARSWVLSSERRATAGTHTHAKTLSMLTDAGTATIPDATEVGLVRVFCAAVLSTTKVSITTSLITHTQFTLNKQLSTVTLMWTGAGGWAVLAYGADPRFIADGTGVISA